MRRVFVPLCILLLTGPACGPREPLPRQLARSARVQQWDIGPDLAARKQVVVDTVRKAGKPDETAALLLAVVMGESERCSANDRDKSKDNAGLAKNYSAFNFNGDYLRSIGIEGAAAEALNDDANLADATRAGLAGLDKYGEDTFLNFHRGGSQGRDDGVSYGCVDFRAHIRAVQATLLADKSLLTSGHRVGDFVPHV